MTACMKSQREREEGINPSQITTTNSTNSESNRIKPSANPFPLSTTNKPQNIPKPQPRSGLEFLLLVGLEWYREIGKRRTRGADPVFQQPPAPSDHRGGVGFDGGGRSGFDGAGDSSGRDEKRWCAGDVSRARLWCSEKTRSQVRKSFNLTKVLGFLWSSSEEKREWVSD